MSLCQIEILVDDLERAKIFYENCLYWKTVPAQMREYAFLEVPHSAGFGISFRVKEEKFLGLSSDYCRSNTILYFQSASEQDFASEEWQKKVKDCGGKILDTNKSLPGVGPVCFLEDPFGQIYGVILKSSL